MDFTYFDLDYFTILVNYYSSSAHSGPCQTFYLLSDRNLASFAIAGYFVYCLKRYLDHNSIASSRLVLIGKTCRPYYSWSMTASLPFYHQSHLLTANFGIEANFFFHAMVS